MADNVTDLIRRARELAKLAEKATPGPWAIVETSGLLIHRGDMAYCDEPECSCMDDGYIATAGRQADAKLIQAAPDMALLLGQLADELERWRNWAESICRNGDRKHMSKGTHAADCPIEDMGLPAPWKE